MRSPLFVVVCLALPLLATGCNSAGQLDPPGFRGVVIRKVQPELDRASVTIDFGLKFRYVNPFPFNLPLPQHTYSLTLGAGNPIVLTPAAPMPRQTVPRSGHLDLTYFTQIVLGEGSNVTPLLGTDAPFRLAAQFTIDPPGNLPNQQVRLGYDDTIRLPRFPQVQLTGPPRLSLIGDLKTVDVKAFRDPMIGAGDFIVSVIDQIPGIGAFNTDGFVAGWNQFKNDVPDKVLDLGRSEVSGLRFETPLRIVNPNTFEIDAPAAAFSVAPTAGAPRANGSVTFAALRYAQGNPTIPGGQSRAVALVTELNWSTLTSGDPIATMQKLMSGDPRAVQLKFNGDVSLDLGYGPVRVPVRLDVTEMLLGPP